MSMFLAYLIALLEKVEGTGTIQEIIRERIRFINDTAEADLEEMHKEYLDAMDEKMIRKGMQKYGPYVPETCTRNLGREGQQELIDAGNYARMAVMKHPGNPDVRKAAENATEYSFKAYKVLDVIAVIEDEVAKQKVDASLPDVPDFPMAI